MACVYGVWYVADEAEEAHYIGDMTLEDMSL